MVEFRRCVLTACCFALLRIGHATACPPELSGKPILGSHRTQTDSKKPVVLQIAQHDLDVVVVARKSGTQSVHNAPGGRNGFEWIYLPASELTLVEICIYPAYRQAFPNSYTLRPVDVSKADPVELKALQLMSSAGISWANGSRASRIAAVEAYADVARRAKPGSVLAVHALLYAGLAKKERYLYDEALRELQPLVENTGQTSYVRYAAAYAVGYMLNRQGDFKGAAAALENGLSIARNGAARMTGQARRDIADITNLLGEVYLSMGQVARGEASVRAAAASSGKDLQLLGMVHNNLGYVYLRRADNDDPALRPKNLGLSIAEHFKGRDYSSRAGDQQELAIIENNLGSLLNRVGDIREARLHFEEALRLIDQTDDPYRFKVLYRALGNIYQLLGDYAKSERFLAAAVDLAEKSEPRDAIRLHCQLGTTRRQLGRLDEAVAEHDLCARRARADGNMDVQAEALHDLTLDHLAKDDAAAAWQSVRDAVELLDGVRESDVRSKVLSQYALLLEQHGDHAGARTKAQLAINAAATARYSTVRVDALAAAMSIHADQGRTSDAIRLGFETLDAIESIHAHLDVERLGPAWSSRTEDVYTQLLTLMVATRDARQSTHLAEILNVLERSRAIGLRQQFSAAPGVLRQVEQSRALSTLSEIANRQAQLPAQSGEMSLAYYHAHDLLTLSRLAGVADMPVPPPLSLWKIRSALGPRQSVLCYFFTADRAYLLLIERTSSELFDLGGRDRIKKLVADVREASARRDGSLAGALHSLSAVMLPALPSKAIDEWIVMPDAALQGLPFSALNVGVARGAYEPAIARYAVKLTPSLSAYFMAKTQRSHDHSVDLAVFADPTFASSQTTPSGRGLQKQAPAGWTETLERLPWTAREAEQLKLLFPPDRIAIYTGRSATRQSLRARNALDARILHIASHGYFRSDSPDNVGFALSAVNNGRDRDSGFITLTELFSYPFDNELVVINACDTAMGVARGGEGMLSLTRGFLAQGSEHVVSTLWPVADRASAVFMEHFYTHLRREGSVARAVRAAQLELRANRTFIDPYFWAPYVLTTVDPNDRVHLTERPLANLGEPAASRRDLR